MTDDKQLDHLISVLYETVLDPSRWREAVGLFGHYVGGVDGQLCTIRKENLVPTTYVLAGTAFSLEGGADYANHYLPIDPRNVMTRNGAVGQWQCCHHFHDQNFVGRNEFYQDFLIPGGVRYAMVAIVDDNDADFTTFGSMRAVGQQPFDEANHLAAQRITSHLQRVLRMQNHTQNLHAKAELGARAIDALALSMLVVDGKGTILHLNTGAERFLNNPLGGLICKAGRLSTADPNNQNRLKGLVAEATGNPAVGGAMFLNGEEARQLFVTPLPAASALAQDWQTPLALILVMDAGKNLPALRLLGTLYDLSPAELRIASALLAGKSLEQYALEAGVTNNTVRSQLKNMFNKTGTHRQSELVSMLSRVPPLHD